jgi:predicted transcriptional regulator
LFSRNNPTFKSFNLNDKGFLENNQVVRFGNFQGDLFIMQNLKQEKKAVSGFKLTQLIIRKQLAKKFDLKQSTTLVLMGLVDCYNEKNGIVFPSIAYLQEHLNIKSESTVILAIKELVSKQLIIKSKAKAKKAKYSHSIYSFTNIFFEFLFAEDEAKVPMKINETTTEILEKPPMKISGKNKIENNKKNKDVFSLKNLTDFQKKYEDVFKELSDNDLLKYKNLKGYEKEEWLKIKRREFRQALESRDLLNKIEEDKKKSGSPLDLSKDEQIKYYESLPQILKNSGFAKEIKARWSLK